MTTTTHHKVRSTSAARTQKRIFAVLGAAGAALAVWTVAVPVAGVTLSVRGDQEVGPVAIAIAALVVGLAGWGLLAVLDRVTRRPRRIWTIVAVSVLLVSLLGPLGSAVGAASVLTLLALHATVGTVLVFGMRRS